MRNPIFGTPAGRALQPPAHHTRLVVYEIIEGPIVDFHGPNGAKRVLRPERKCVVTEHYIGYTYESERRYAVANETRRLQAAFPNRDGTKYKIVEETPTPAEVDAYLRGKAQPMHDTIATRLAQARAARAAKPAPAPKKPTTIRVGHG